MNPENLCPDRLCQGELLAPRPTSDRPGKAGKQHETREKATNVAEDDIIYWQDVLESVLANRTTGLKCPFCYEESIFVERTELKTVVKCVNKECRHFIEGKFGPGQVEEA
jgi:hypothetical protein